MPNRLQILALAGSLVGLAVTGATSAGRVDPRAPSAALTDPNELPYHSSTPEDDLELGGGAGAPFMPRPADASDDEPYQEEWIDESECRGGPNGLIGVGGGLGGAFKPARPGRDSVRWNPASPPPPPPPDPEPGLLP